MLRSRHQKYLQSFPTNVGVHGLRDRTAAQIAGDLEGWAQRRDKADADMKRARLVMGGLSTKKAKAKAAGVYTAALARFKAADGYVRRLEKRGRQAEKREGRAYAEEAAIRREGRAELRADMKAFRDRRDKAGVARAEAGVSAEAFESAMRTRIERVWDKATPEEQGRIIEAFQGGIEAAKRGVKKETLNDFEQGIEAEIAVVDARVKEANLITKLEEKEKAGRKALAAAQKRIAAATTPEEKRAAEVDEEIARDKLGIGNAPTPDAEKTMNPDAAAKVAWTAIKDAQRGLDDGADLGIEGIHEALSSMSIEALIIGSYSKLHIDANAREAMLEVAGKKAAEELNPGYSGSDTRDQARMDEMFRGIMSALPVHLRTDVNRVKIARILGY